MTAKRDFKRRVRQRQTRTGESYVTARRHLVASRPAGDTPDEAGDAGEPAQPGEAAGAQPPTAPEPSPGTAAETASAAAPASDAGAAEAPALAAGAGQPPPAAAIEPPSAGYPNAATLAEVGAAFVQSTAAVANALSAATPSSRTESIPVVELVDVTDEARRFGFLCRVVMFPSVTARIDAARVLGRLRDLLIATVDDPSTARLAALALTGQGWQPRPAPQDFHGLRRFLQRARAGLGGTFGETALAFHVPDGDGMVPILCALSGKNDAIELSVIDHLVPERWEVLESMATELGERRPGGAIERARAAVLATPPLFVVHEGKRHAVTHDRFVIGRGTGSDLAIKDGLVSREHAAVIRRSGAYYLKDLGSTGGVHYKGMRIDNKRIDEGDVFEIAGHEIAFTFRDR